MAVTVTLSDDVSERLLSYARKLHLPLDALVDRLVGDALPVAEQDEPESVQPETTGVYTDQGETVQESNFQQGNALPSFDEVLARIKAIPPNPNAIEPATKTVKELVADLEADPPSGDLMTFEEMWPLWQNFEQELKSMDEADAHRDRLG